jgi:hypothetical protein
MHSICQLVFLLQPDSHFCRLMPMANQVNEPCSISVSPSTGNRQFWYVADSSRVCLHIQQGRSTLLQSPSNIAYTNILIMAVLQSYNAISNNRQRCWCLEKCFGPQLDARRNARRRDGVASNGLPVYKDLHPPITRCHPAICQKQFFHSTSPSSSYISISACHRYHRCSSQQHGSPQSLLCLIPKRSRLLR